MLYASCNHVQGALIRPLHLLAPTKLLGVRVRVPYSRLPERQCTALSGSPHATKKDKKKLDAARRVIACGHDEHTTLTDTPPSILNTKPGVPSIYAECLYVAVPFRRRCGQRSENARGVPSRGGRLACRGGNKRSRKLHRPVYRLHAQTDDDAHDVLVLKKPSSEPSHQHENTRQRQSDKTRRRVAINK